MACTHTDGIEHIGDGWYRCMKCDKMLDKDHRDPSIKTMDWELREVMLRELNKPRED